MRSADEGVGDARLVAAMVEIEALKAENDRLRSLLGSDRVALSAPAAAWEPTLFAEPTSRDGASTGVISPRVGQSPMSRAGKVALFRSLFVGREDVYASRLEERVDAQGGLVARGEGRVGECSQAGT